jgi:hypothetical protein
LTVPLAAAQALVPTGEEPSTNESLSPESRL